MATRKSAAKQGKTAARKGKSTKGRVISAANVAKARVAYDRTLINVLVAQNREEGVTRLYPNHGKYEKAVSKSPDARTVYDNGDEVATMLRNVSLEELWMVAQKHLSKEVVKQKQAQYEGKNIGMIRMNIGNLIRGSIARKRREAEIAKAAKKAA